MGWDVCYFVPRGLVEVGGDAEVICECCLCVGNKERTMDFKTAIGRGNNYHIPLITYVFPS